MLAFLSQNPQMAFVYLFAIVIALTIHEASHAIAAYLLGDKTAYNQGRMSFNPLVHLDLFGSLLFLVVGFGWGKPVPIDDRNFKDRVKGQALTALAGPASNLVGAVFAVIMFHLAAVFIGPNNMLMVFLYLFFFINIILMTFNLIPLPPLDGSRVVELIIPRRWQKYMPAYERYGAQVLLGLVILAVFLNVPIFAWIFKVVHFFAAIFNMPTLI